MVRFLVAPDSFKGSLSAEAAAGHLAGGIRMRLPDAEVEVLPLADGGEGTIEALRWTRGGRLVRIEVQGPLGTPVLAPYLRMEDGTAAIEMASAAGLGLVPAGLRDPMRATTYGVGELIAHAVEAGARKLLVGTGGSATVDGGTGALNALGVRFLDETGVPLPAGGGALGTLAHAEVSPRLTTSFRDVRVQVLCDVDNPLLGEAGAARTYGPQKGASEEAVERLEAGLAAFARVARTVTGVDPSAVPGAGSAGGLAGGLGAFLRAELVLGAPRIMEIAGFAAALGRADVVVTGEGKVDGQTARGKVVAAVAAACGKAGKPCIVAAGRLGEDWRSVFALGVREVVSCFPGDAPESRRLYARTPAELARIGYEVAARWGA